MSEHRGPRSFRDLLAFAFPVLMDRPRVVGFGALATAMLAVLWVSPVSPFALARADAALGDGLPQVAAERYDAIARWNPASGMREDALLRAATVWAVDLRDPREARRRLERMVEERPGDERLAVAYEQLAHVLLHDERQPGEAAEAYARAFQVRPTADRLMRAAMALDEAGQVDRALAHWEQVGEQYEQHRPRSLIGRAEILLRSGDPQAALALYEQAERVSTNADQDALARLGVATCLERLGNLDEALAAIDLTDLPGEVRETRLERIRARRASGAAAP